MTNITIITTDINIPIIYQLILFSSFYFSSSPSSSSLFWALQKLFINDLLKPPEQRPTTSEAYYNAISFYSLKYLQTTSICSTLLCFNSIIPINQYFKGEKIKNFILSDEQNKTENYIITKIVKGAIDATHPSNFNYKNARLECLKLRMSIYVDRDRMESSTEVDLNNFVSQLLPLLHKELNKSKGGNQPIRKADESNEADVIKKKAFQFATEKPFF